MIELTKKEKDKLTKHISFVLEQREREELKRLKEKYEMQEEK